MLATSLNYTGAGRRSYQMHTLNYGVRLGAGLTLTVDAARSELKRLAGVIKARAAELWNPSSEIVVAVGEYQGDPAVPHIVISDTEAAEIQAAADRLARDIRDKTGVQEPTLIAANAFPQPYMAPTVDVLLDQMGKLRATHSDATGASEFPTSVVLLTIGAVGAIAGLMVWGVAKRGKRGPRGPRGYRGRRRRRR